MMGSVSYTSSRVILPSLQLTSTKEAPAFSAAMKDCLIVNPCRQLHFRSRADLNCILSDLQEFLTIDVLSESFNFRVSKQYVSR